MSTSKLIKNNEQIIGMFFIVPGLNRAKLDMYLAVLF